MAINIYEIIGYMAGVMTAVCFLPQTIKTIKTRRTEDISAVSYAAYCFGILCWVIYGTYLGSVQMIVFNLISLVFAFIILGLTLLNLRKKKGKEKLK